MGAETGSWLGPDGLRAEAGCWLDPDGLCAAFARAHERRYGFRDETAQVELVNMRVSVWGPATQLRPRPAAREGPDARSGEIVIDGRPQSAAILRGELTPGTAITGPALCAMPHATLLVAPGWAGQVDEHGTVRLHHEQGG
jgi:N-methylhydantoinase A